MKYRNAKVRRLQKRIRSLTDIIKELRNSQMISSNCKEMLRQSCSGVPLEVMKRITSKKSRASYSEELKSFALTLCFYSLKAYNYVLKTFLLALPHPLTLRTWYRGFNGQPEFTNEAFATLSLRITEEEKKQGQFVCALGFDEMAIKKHIERTGSIHIHHFCRVCGYRVRCG